jgi:hypothetical protein
MKFKDQASADQFYIQHNGKQFNSLGVIRIFEFLF